MTSPLLGGDEEAWKGAGKTLGSKLEASHCAGVGASGLINLTIIGHGLKMQKAEGHRLGAKNGGEWSQSSGAVAFLIGQERLEVRLREPDRKQEWGDQLGQSRCS